MQHPIEFASPSDLAHTTSSPWSSPTKAAYRNLALKPEFRDRIHRFPVGESTVRVIPPLAGSTHGWLLGCHVLKYVGGQHLHPRSLTPGALSVFDLAYRWIVKNKPELLFSKRRPDGYRLLADPLSVCGLLVEAPGTRAVTVKWLVAGAYDGSRGGVPGLGHSIWNVFQGKDKAGKLIADPGDLANCPDLVVNRVQPKGARYPSYSLQLGHTPAPISEWLDRMDPSELDLMRPLENVVHIPGAEEEWELLKNVLPPELVAKIRADS